MNGGYRRAIPYAADDSPDRLWAGSGPVRWIMRGGKPVAWQCETTIELPAEQCSVGTVRLPLSQRPLERVCGHERICISCKAHFQSNSKKTAKWCPDCRRKRQKQKQAEWEKTHRTGQNIPPQASQMISYTERGRASGLVQWGQCGHGITHLPSEPSAWPMQRAPHRGGETSRSSARACWPLPRRAAPREVAGVCHRSGG